MSDKVRSFDICLSPFYLRLNIIMGYLSNTLFTCRFRAETSPASQEAAVWLPPVYLQGARLKNAGNGDLGLVGEIRTRIIVVAVRHITFLSPRE